jgi:hypothetical protein
MHDWLGVGLIGAIRPEYAAMGKMVRPLVLFGVGFVALKMSLFYFIFGGNRLMTPLEFAGLLFVMATYCGYLVAATMRPGRATETARTSEPDAIRSAT